MKWAEGAAKPRPNHSAFDLPTTEFVTEGDIGRRVIAEKKGPGILRWVGTADFGKGPAIYCGVELDRPLEWGGGNGSVLGVAYFSCDDGKGVFLTRKRVAIDPTSHAPSPAKPSPPSSPPSASPQAAAAVGEVGPDDSEPDWSHIEPTEQDIKDATMEIQRKFLLATGDEKSIAFAKRMKELHVGSSSKKKDDWVPQYLKTIHDEKAMVSSCCFVVDGGLSSTAFCFKSRPRSSTGPMLALPL